MDRKEYRTRQLTLKHWRQVRSLGEAMSWNEARSEIVARQGAATALGSLRPAQRTTALRVIEILLGLRAAT